MMLNLKQKMLQTRIKRGLLTLQVPIPQNGQFPDELLECV